ncbi:hypothetical protein EGW08_016396 [Elysia chlorotica]|uniref:H15 domain-containing protein n=1 Tax=Elysia chlorotica TaxID=188477 RepID=A0A3S1BAC0_ELYCH|nr:hypothetical protein EGW08_016396 [Elysia chlorotica]
MPAIKKKWIKANQEVIEADTNENNDNAAGEVGVDASSKASPKGNVSPVKPKKRNIDPLMLRALDGEVLLEKRKRFTPPAEAKLSDWLDSNLEKRNDVTLSQVQLYKYYTELCQGEASDIMDMPAFNRMIKKKFGKTFGIKESSVYKSVLKERNLNQKKPGSGIKLKEIAHEAIKHFGNPYSGVRFFSLKQFVATKYPSLKIDQRPKILKRILEMGVGYGQIDLVKGIGMAGFYRLPGAEPPKPKVKQDKDSSKEESTAEEPDSAGSAEAEEPSDKDDSAKDDKKLESAKSDTKEDSETPDKVKDPKPKKLEKCNLKQVPHGNPKKIEDTLPLAITFQSAPKTASIVKIRRYIQDNYQQIVPDSRMRKAVESGAEKGHWEYISGSGITGRLHLLMDDFDPDSENLQDMICAAIIACHEPKAASGNQIKKYISRYHPDFNVDTRPDRFKKALVRAADRNMIKQLSGLGANGSFELSDVFVPTPRVLSGEDASSGDEEDNSSDEEPIYVPKATKSRSSPQKKPTNKQEPARKPPGSAKKGAAVKKGTPAKKGPVAKGRGRPSGKVSKKGRKLKVKEESEDEESDVEMEVQAEYTPRKSQSRGGPARTTPSAKKPGPKSKKSKKVSKSTAPRQPRQRSVTPSDNEADDDEEPEYTPQKTKSRGRLSAPTTPEQSGKSPARKGKSPAVSPGERKTVQKAGGGSITTLNTSFHGDSDEDQADRPRKSSSRGGSLSPSKNKRKK